MAGLARTIAVNPDYRSGLREGSDDALRSLTAGVKRELTRPPETQFEQDVSDVGTAIKSGVTALGSGLSNIAETTMSGISSGLRTVGTGINDYFTKPPQTTPPPVNVQAGVSPSGVSPVKAPAVSVPAPAAKPTGMGLMREPSPPVVTEPERIYPETRGVIEMGGVKTYVPETRAQREERVNVGGLVVPRSSAEDVISQKIENLVSDLMTPRATPGGLRVSNKKLEMVKDIRLGQLGMAKAAEQTRITGEYGLAGHKLTADIASDIRRQTLEEKVRHNKILEQDYNLRLQQQRDVSDQNALQKILSQFAVQEADPTNPGEKSVNMRHTYFNIWDSGTTPHPAISDAVKQMGDAYQGYREQTMKLSGKKSLAPDEEKAVKARFRKSLSQYSQIQ
jgi:hypothetical protein